MRDRYIMPREYGYRVYLVDYGRGRGELGKREREKWGEERKAVGGREREERREAERQEFLFRGGTERESRLERKQEICLPQLKGRWWEWAGLVS